MSESPGWVSSFLGRRTSMPDLFSPKLGERLAGQPVHGPLGVGLRPQSLVKTDRIAVPVEDGPLEPPAAPLHRDAGQRFQQSPPDAAAAMLRDHEQVLEVDPGQGEKGREVVEEEGEADRLSGCFSKQRLGKTLLAE